MHELEGGWGARHVGSDLDDGPLVESIAPGRRRGEGLVSGFGRANELADSGSEGRHCDEQGGLGKAEGLVK